MSEASKRVTSGLLARAVVRTAVALGADGPKLLRDAEVAQPVMEDASVRLTGEEMDRIWAAAMTATGNPGLGYIVGQAVDPTELGPATTLIASTDNLVNAMELAVRYSPLIGRQAYRMRRNGREIRLAMDVSCQPMFASHEPGAELSMTVWTRLARRLGGESVCPTLIRFRHRRPASADAMELFFQCPLRFDCAIPEISFALHDAERRSAYADPALVSAMTAYADALLASLKPRTSTAEGVALHLLAGSTLRDATAESTASALGVSPRTLYRRLKADGDSYQGILDRVRHQRCLAQLEEGHVAPTELSARLGFAEASSFYRAFQRWAGRSFATFREERERAAQ